MKRFALVILIIFSASPTLVIAQADGFHLTYEMGEPSNSITLTWIADTNSTSWVLYDTSSHQKLDGYSFRTEANSTKYAGDYIYNANLNGLDPDTRYFFIYGNNEEWSGERSFETAPVERSHIRIIAGGDSRTNHDVRDKISLIMSRYNPDLVLHSGDFVEDGLKRDLWMDFLNHTDVYWVTNKGLTIPIIPAIGNHDTGGENYRSLFALPGDELWYSLDYGPDIHIIVLSTESDVDELDKQTEWLKSDLEGHSNYPWILVMFHRNVLRNHHREWLYAYHNWVPLFDKYEVDVVINGHSHNYMRSKPINWTRSQIQAQDSYKEGIMYLVSGGWGAPLYESVQGWWVANTTKKNHFMLMDFYANGTLELKSIDDENRTFDSVILEKSLPDYGEMMYSRIRFLREEKKDLEIQLGVLREKEDQMLEKIEQLNNTLNSLKEDKTGLEETVTEMNEEIQSLKEKIETIDNSKSFWEESKVLIAAVITIMVTIGVITLNKLGEKS